MTAVSLMLQLIAAVVSAPTTMSHFFSPTTIVSVVAALPPPSPRMIKVPPDVSLFGSVRRSDRTQATAMVPAMISNVVRSRFIPSVTLHRVVTCGAPDPIFAASFML
jgi:hypothetical protein